MNKNRPNPLAARRQGQETRKAIPAIVSHGGRFAITGSIFILSLASVSAQFEITSGTGDTSEDFDSLNDVNSSADVVWVNDTTLSPGDSTLAGWSLFDSLFSPIGNYRGGNGGSTTGSFYSFGTDSDRALGGVGSGGAYFGNPDSGAVAGYLAFGAKNNSGSTLTRFSLGFDGEQWRNANSDIQTMMFEFGFGADFASVSEWQAPGGNFNWGSPAIGPPSGAINGNAAGKVSARGGDANGLIWVNGETLWLRWIELNDPGSDHGLAIDNFSFSWMAGVPPRSLTWSPGASAVWDSTAINWADGAAPATFADFDRVSFTDSGLVNGSTVNIQAGGVNTGGFNVSNSSGTYTFTGGPIGGSGILTKTGAGSLILSTSYARPVVVSEGSLRTTASDLLADTGSISLAEGTSLDLGGNSDTVAALSLTGATITAGPGRLTVDGNITVGESDMVTSIGGNLSQGGSDRVYTVNDGGANLDLLIDAVISGPGRIRFAGNGTVRLNGDNSGQTGGFEIDPTIRLIMGNRNALGTGELYLDGGRIEIPSDLTDANAVMTPISLGGDPILSGMPLELAGDFRIHQAVERAITNDNDLIMSGTFSDGTAPDGMPLDATLRKDGIGTLTVSGNNSGFSADWVHTRGTLVAASGNALGTGAVLIIPFFGEDTALEIAVSTTMGPLSSFDDSALVRLGTGPANVMPVVLTIAPTELASGSFRGSIQEAEGHVGGVTIAGNGVQVLGGNNSYSGPTKVDSGTLVVMGSINGTSGVEVAADAILGGSGFINLSPTGSLVADADAILAPQGEFIQTGVLNVVGEPLTLPNRNVEADGAIFQFELGATSKGGTFNGANDGLDDGLNIVGTLSLDRGLLQGSLLFGFNNDVGDLFFVIFNDGIDPINGTFAGVAQGSTVTFSGSAGSVDFAVSYTGDSATTAFTAVDGNDVVLRALTAIPEPGSAAFFVVGLLGLITHRPSRARGLRRRFVTERKLASGDGIV